MEVTVEIDFDVEVEDGVLVEEGSWGIEEFLLVEDEDSIAEGPLEDEEVVGFPFASSSAAVSLSYPPFLL